MGGIKMTERKMLLFIVALSILCSLSNTAYSFYPQQLEQLQTTKNCPGCYLTNITLPNAVLNNANFSNADLYGANLSSANLYRANMSNANLNGINMSNAGMYSANLSNSSAQVAILTNANLYGANLSSAVLTGANLSGANLHGANLSNSDLLGANLSGADLHLANLTSANAKSANLSGANINNANLCGTIFDLATWIDGDRCLEGSIGYCKKAVDLRAVDEEEEEEEASAPREGRAEMDTSSPFEDILFDVAKYDLKPEARRTLDKVSEWLKERPNYTLLIEGHCDERADADYNLTLGENRARSAMKYLTDLGVAKERITTISYGYERPVNPGHNEAAWEKNRRCHFIVSVKK